MCLCHINVETHFYSPVFDTFINVSKTQYFLVTLVMCLCHINEETHFHIPGFDTIINVSKPVPFGNTGKCVFTT